MKLAKPQKLIYNMEKYAGGSISIICGSMLIDGKRKITELKSTVNEIYKLNDALRIRIAETEGEVEQIVTEYVEKDVEVLYFANKTELDSYAEKYAQESIDLYGDLCEIKIVILPERFGLLAKLHHMVGDAWTLSLLGTQFNKILNGEKVESYSYVDYIEKENDYLQSVRYEKDKEFFIEQFKKCDEVTYINEKQNNTLTSKRKTFILDVEETKKIKAYIKKRELSPFMLFTAVIASYVNRVKMNVEKFYIGTAVLNRNGIKEKNTAGMFINTVPMLIELDNNKSFEENLRGIEKSVFSVLRHQKCNCEDISVEIRKEYKFNEKLYDVTISYQNATVEGSDFETTWYHSGMQSESLQIHIDDRDNKGVYRIHYNYLTDKFSEDEINIFHQHIEKLLFDAIYNEDKKLYELEILTDDERQKLFFDFNDTTTDYPRDKCVHQLFEEQVERTPDKIAVIACDKELTYMELNKEANSIAHLLIEKGVCVGDIVAFSLSRKSHLIATILGILKTGAAYLPIDTDYPQERVEYMLADSKAKILLTDDDLIELSIYRKDNPTIEICSDDYCYVIYTSGTTGEPKGILIRHRNLVNFCINNYHQRMISCGTRLISTFKYCFDAFGVDYALVLLNGLSIVLASDDEITNPELLADLMKNYAVDIIHTTPSTIRIYGTNEKYLTAMKNIKIAIIAAEKFTYDIYELMSRYSNAKIINGYGPSETTIGVAFGEIDSKGISVGRPTSNTQFYIVDRYLQPTSIGVVGELCVAGDNVGAGYLNRSELTAEKFIENPFGEGKLYKTGDLVYWRKDGNVAYVGRNDFQVKVRGLRIELEEIENAICNTNNISQSVVVVRENNEGRQFICAFYTGNEIPAKEIRKNISKKIPKYMVPHIFLHLNEMPLTANGKVNRKALPEIELENIVSDTEYVAPQSKQQKELCQIIEQVLDVKQVGIKDNFFDIGGDSLRAIEFVSKSHNEGIYFNLQNVYDCPTVEELCKWLENSDKQREFFSNVDFTEVNKILEKNSNNCIVTPRKTEIGNILLAGATGYLGIHILANYIENDKGTAFCLVRGNNRENSEARLKSLLNFYFGDKYEDMHRIEVICADLQKENMGLAQTEYEKLICSVNTVINAAASVKHYGSYKYFYESNVESTKRLIDFCKESGAKLVHTSTLSVSGNSFGDQFDGVISDVEKNFYESNLYIEQPLENVYARSKFEAEKAVLDAMTDGLQANILRMGNLTNRLSDGIFQKNYESNAFLKRIKSVIELKAFPDYLLHLYVEFTPIDEAAEAVMNITRHFNNEYTVFHINSTKVMYIEKLIDCLVKLDFKIDILNETDFSRVLQHNEFAIENLINELDENYRLNYDSNIHINNDFTVEYLKSLGFEWSDIDFEYIRMYIEYFRKIGYLK